MQDAYIEDEKPDPKKPLLKGEYLQCEFHHFNFQNVDLAAFRFIECTFMACDFSLARLNGTHFQEVSFQDCKMLGLRFDTCQSLGLAFNFTNCQLNHSSFFKTKLKKTTFKNCQLEGVDFAEADLTAATFDNCDLLNATFDQTLLEKADFRTAYNYSLDPELNRIRKAKFSLAGIPGLLSKYDLHIE